VVARDEEVSGVLNDIRTVARLWKDLVDSDPIDKFVEIGDKLEGDFSQLETLTRTSSIDLRLAQYFCSAGAASSFFRCRIRATLTLPVTVR
jgi:hypothetical protein